MNTKMHLRALLGVLFSLLWLAPGIAAKPSRRTAKATVSFKEVCPPQADSLFPPPSLRVTLCVPLHLSLLSSPSPEPANTPQTNDFCETTPNVKSYAGYVRLPAGSQYAPYEQNIFFWFFEARSNPKSAPLTVWLQGGPGMGSTSQVSPLPLPSPHTFLVTPLFASPSFFPPFPLSAPAFPQPLPPRVTANNPPA